MPRGDGRGPMGQGPMTGRAAGYCSGSPAPGYMNPAPGRGFANRGHSVRGRGIGGQGGRGWQNRFCTIGWGFGPFATYGDPSSSSTVREEEIELLREQATFCAETLENIKKRIEKLSAREEKD